MVAAFGSQFALQTLNAPGDTDVALEDAVLDGADARVARDVDAAVRDEVSATSYNLMSTTLDGFTTALSRLTTNNTRLAIVRFSANSATSETNTRVILERTTTFERHNEILLQQAVLLSSHLGYASSRNAVTSLNAAGMDLSDRIKRLETALAIVPPRGEKQPGATCEDLIETYEDITAENERTIKSYENTAFMWQMLAFVIGGVAIVSLLVDQ